MKVYVVTAYDAGRTCILDVYKKQSDAKKRAEVEDRLGSDYHYELMKTDYQTDKKQPDWYEWEIDVVEYDVID